VYLYSASSRSASNVLLLPICHRYLRKPVLQPGISEHCETTNTGWCITQYACLLPQLLPGTHSSLPQRVGSGWAGLGAWFCAEVVYTHPGTNWA